MQKQKRFEIYGHAKLVVSVELLFDVPLRGKSKVSPSFQALRGKVFPSKTCIALGESIVEVGS
jgi:hypothetical protein